MKYKVDIEGLEVEDARPEECGTILNLIKEIALYEKMLDQVTATEESLYESIFVQQRAHVVLIRYQQKEIGYMLYFFNYSTFTGGANLYLEDLFILKEYRHFGIGKQMFQILAQIALTNNCQRIDWVCLDWNETGLKFYQSIGAELLDFWVVHRLEKDNIKRVADGRAFLKK